MTELMYHFRKKKRREKKLDVEFEVREATGRIRPDVGSSRALELPRNYSGWEQPNNISDFPLWMIMGEDNNGRWGWEVVIESWFFVCFYRLIFGYFRWVTCVQCYHATVRWDHLGGVIRRIQDLSIQRQFYLLLLYASDPLGPRGWFTATSSRERRITVTEQKAEFPDPEDIQPPWEKN